MRKLSTKWFKKWAKKSNLNSKNMLKAINSYLPLSVRVEKITKAPSGFHARFSAKAKLYRYVILHSKEFDVFMRFYAWFIDANMHSLDITKMEKAAKRIAGTRDFSCFVKQASGQNNTVRTIYQITIKRSRRKIIIDVLANGFMRGMVRAIVRLLADVGTGRLKLNDITKIIKSRSRANIGKPAPGCGLYLKKVYYRKIPNAWH